MRTRPLRWLIVVAWCLGIFAATASPAYTGEHTRQAVSTSLPAASAAAVAVINVILRKATHTLVFGGLAAVTWWALPSGSSRSLWAWSFASLYAISDEAHQLFVPGRSGEVWDALLDSAAALAVLTLISIFLRRRRR